MNTHRAIVTAALQVTIVALLCAHDAAGQQAVPPRASGPSVGTDADGVLSEIVVTANHQEQSLSKVPISIAVITPEQIDKQGIKTVEDLARLTPGVSFTDGGLRLNTISIRGVSSPAGASTTGLYIDETAIQARLIGNSSGNTFPRIFDLERVEVLRGPQGTVFGAGAEGGAVRFITPQPSLTEYTGYARAEGSSIDSGGLNYEAGGAFGGPIVQDKLGFRVSAYFRRDGGWIDRESGTFTILSPNGSKGPDDSLSFTPDGRHYDNSNWENTKVVRAALTWSPIDNLKITPSVYYQDEDYHDLIQSYWSALSSPGDGQFAAPWFLPSVDATHTALPGAPAFEPDTDHFTLPSLLVQWDLGKVRLVSNSAYFDRVQNREPDYTYTEARTYGGAARALPLPGDKAYSPFLNTQKNFSQELRVQNNDPAARLNWQAGLFYTHNEQIGNQSVPVNFLSLLPSVGQNGASGAVNGGAPYGPGSTAFENYFGIGLVNGATYLRLLSSTDEQKAAFGQLDFNITSKLKVTAGVRVAQSTFDYTATYNGPSNNLNQPHGLACVPGTGAGGVPCNPVPVGAYGVGEGPFAPAFVDSSGGSTEHPITPKFSLSYQADEDNLFYASAAKGYRPGGAQAVLPSGCYAELISDGYTDGAGHALSPQTYKSDSVWSYEVGAKNRLFGGTLQLDSSIYYIKWKDIQSTVNINSCTQSFVDNLGGATSKGGDIAVQWLPIKSLLIGIAVAYDNATFDEATVLGTRVLYTKGSAIPDAGSPWTATLTDQFNFTFAQHGAYVRTDYTFNSARQETGATDPGSYSYDNQLYVRPKTSLVNGRLGMVIDDFDCSIFVNNAIDAHPSLTISRTKGTSAFMDYSYVPRTIGITVAKRF